MDFAWDIETFPNVFTMGIDSVDFPVPFCFEISEFRNDFKIIMQFLIWMRENGHRMVGFNSVGFDYPVLHTMIQMGKGDAPTLYRKAMSIIQSQDDDGRFRNQIKPSDRYVEQIDLFKIHHFDNFAKATSLKEMEFNMQMDNIADLPFPVGTTLDRDQIVILKNYQMHDVKATKMFYHKSIDAIRFREEMTRIHGKDFMNHNDTKIGEDYFIIELEKDGVPCYDFGPEGRKPRQSERSRIHLKDAILPWIRFTNDQFQAVLDRFMSATIKETNGVFKDITATINGFTFVFGLGGIHGSVSNQEIQSTSEKVIIDLDVTSYYPSIAIVNKFFPEHLGDKFCDIYTRLKEKRLTYKKKSVENEMLKLALNGSYGKSNSRFSVFYDPLFTMKITLNGQLLLCMLAEKLMNIPSLELLQINTDGLTMLVDRDRLHEVEAVRESWESLTRMSLEEVEYRQMFIADVNNYLAVDVNGNVKKKGRYLDKLDWDQNFSALVVPKLAVLVLLGPNFNIRKALEEWNDRMDFMIRVKVPRSSNLADQDGNQIQNTTRYYVSKGGVELFKLMPPLAGKTEWRRFAIEKNRTVCVCNDIKDATLPIDFDYYVEEIIKLTGVF